MGYFYTTYTNYTTVPSPPMFLRPCHRPRALREKQEVGFVNGVFGLVPTVHRPQPSAARPSVQSRDGGAHTPLVKNCGASLFASILCTVGGELIYLCTSRAGSDWFGLLTVPPPGLFRTLEKESKAGFLLVGGPSRGCRRCRCGQNAEVWCASRLESFSIWGCDL